MNANSIKNLKTDNDAVSPVIGVILMVAITVILAAVIGAFVIGIGDDQEAVPQASWDISQSTHGVDDADGDAIDESDRFPEIAIKHTNGETISESNLDITVDGTPALDAETDYDSSSWAGFSSNEVVFSGSNDINAGTNVRVIAGDGLNSGTVDDSVEAGELLSSGNTVRIIWESDSGGDSSVLQDYTVN